MELKYVCILRPFWFHCKRTFLGNYLAVSTANSANAMFYWTSIIGCPLSTLHQSLVGQKCVFRVVSFQMLKSAIYFRWLKTFQSNNQWCIALVCSDFYSLYKEDNQSSFRKHTSLYMNSSGHYCEDRLLTAVTTWAPCQAGDRDRARAAADNV